MENTFRCDECLGTGEMATSDALCPVCNGWGTISDKVKKTSPTQEKPKYDYANFYESDACESEDAVTEGKGLQFDKFMDNILVKEGRTVVRQKQEDNPLRRRAALHQDRPANRTVIGPRK